MDARAHDYQHYDGDDRRRIDPNAPCARVRALEVGHEQLALQLAEVVGFLREMPDTLSGAVTKGMHAALTDRETLAATATLGGDMLAEYGKARTGGLVWRLFGAGLSVWAFRALVVLAVWNLVGTDVAKKVWAALKV